MLVTTPGQVHITNVVSVRPDPNHIEMLTTIMIENRQAVAVNGTLECDDGGDVLLAKVYLRVYKDAPFDSVEDLPASEEDVLGQEPAILAELLGDKTWKREVFGVDSSVGGKPNQLVIWAYGNPVRGCEPLRRLVNFKAKRGSGLIVPSIEIKSITIGHPNPSDPNDKPYPVNNAAGSSAGNIIVRGTAVGFQPDTPVYLIVVPGKWFVTGSLPKQPLPGSKLVRVGSNGAAFSCGDVSSAACTKSAAYAPNQLITWVSNGDGTFTPSLTNFDGKCMN